MDREVRFQLVDRHGSAVTPAIFVDMAPHASVEQFKRTVKHKLTNTYLHGIAAYELLVVANRVAFECANKNNMEPLDDDASIETLGRTSHDALIVQALAVPRPGNLHAPAVLPDKDAYRQECSSLAQWSAGTIHEIPLIHAFMAKLGGCTATGQVYWRQEDADVAAILLKSSWLTESGPSLSFGSRGILEGSPGSGKSTLLCLLAFYIALHGKKSVLVYRHRTGFLESNSLLFLRYVDDSRQQVHYFCEERCQTTRAAAVYKQLHERHGVVLMLDGFEYREIPHGLGTFTLLATSQPVDLTSKERDATLCVLHPCWKKNDLATLGASVYGWTSDQVEERFFYSGGSLADFTRASMAHLEAAVVDAVRRVEGPVGYLDLDLASHATARQLGYLRRTFVRDTLSTDDELKRERIGGREQSVDDRYTCWWWWTHVIDSEFAVQELSLRRYGGQ